MTLAKGQIIAAKVFLIAMLVLAVFNIASFYQTEYTLVSPLIPRSTVLEVGRPHLFTGLITTMLAIPALLCYFFRWYVVTIVICAVTIAWQVFYLSGGI